jgi:tetratricopeptide (TPR) repeat protein
MKKIVMIVVCLLVAVSVFAEPIKVAIGSLERKDRDSDYIVNALEKRDLKNLFKKTDNYELMDIRKTSKKIDEVTSREFIYLKKDEKLQVAKEIGAGIIMWGNVSSLSGSRFKISMDILSAETGEFINTVFEVPKNTDERLAILEDKLICELDNSCQSSSQLILDIAMQQYATRNYDSAAESFLAVLGANPANVQALYYLGAIYYIQRDYEASIEYFTKAHDLDPGNDDILNQMSIVYARMEMYEEAVETLQQMSDFESNPDVWMRIASLYKNIDYDTEAQEAYENVIALTDTMDTAYLELANLLYDLEYYDEALPYMEEASRRYPDDDALNKKLATTYKKTGKIESAIRQYQDLIKANPDNLRAYYNLANAYTSISSYDKALETALQLETKDPDNPNVYILKSNSYSSLKQYDKAEKAAGKALELDPDNYMAYRILSEIYQGKGYIKYEQYLDYEEQAKNLYGNEADEMIDKRDTAKQQANKLFKVSEQYLQEAKSRTEQSNELNYIREREKTLIQLLEATKKSFF